MLKQRIITGVLLAAAVLAALLWLSPRGLIIALGLATLVACWEWSDLAGLKTVPGRLLFCGLSVAAMAAMLGFTGLLSELPDLRSTRLLLGIAALWWCVAWLGVKTFPGSSKWWGSVGVRLAMGWLVLLPAWLACAYLRTQQIDGEWKILFLLGLVAAADIGAYFSGRRFGRHKLAPAVSPGKSWEGFWGGLAASVLFAALIWWLYWEQLPLTVLLVVAALTVLASVLGDLLESMVKRYRGVKDSSNLLPGHGGVMDRLDSISAAAPIFALGLLLAL